MKKIDISEVTSFDQLYITKSSKVEGKEEVNVPKYVIESEMISYEGSILEEINDVDIIKVNVDTYSDLANKFRIMSIPHLVFYKDGEIICSSVGFIDKETLLEKIEETKSSR